VDPGKEVPGAPAANPDYFTVKLKSPFHVIDTGAGAAETEVIELDSGTVGRRHGEGEEWAWLQLDSGLMGLMKKRALRPASQNEVTAYLAAESKSSARLAGAKEPQRSATPQDDHPRESPRAETLTIAAVESAARSFDAPSDAAVPKEQAPRVESPVVAPPVSKTIPLDGGAASGVIAVPSPVPILP
jgi:hypothetical protein